MMGISFHKGSFVLALFFLALSCGSNKSMVSKKQEIPAWVNSRPISSEYYIGIGSVDKRYQADYQMEAKKKALNEMASEISVRVQGETFINTLEVNNSFSEEYISNIKTSTDAKIDDYETVGIYETPEQYHVYYRVNKAAYWGKIAQKKRQVLDVAYDYYLKGKTAEQQLNIAGAYDLYMHGLVSMKDYWNEPNEYLGSEGKVFLDNELYQRIHGLYDNLKVSVKEGSVILSNENAFSQDVHGVVTFKGNPIKGISISYSYEKENYSVPKVVTSNELGEIMFTVMDAKASPNNAVVVQVTSDGIVIGDIDKTLQQGLTKNLRFDRVSIPLQIRTPSFYIQSNEKHFGSLEAANTLGAALSKSLVERGMRVSNSLSESDYVVTIESDTKDGGFSNGFALAYLNASIIIKRNGSEQVVFQENLSQVKGLHTVKDTADIKAYEQAKKQIEQQMIKSILSAIL